MVKFILIIAIAFGIYKMSPTGNSQMGSGEEVVSTEYGFKVNFDLPPKVTSKVNNIPGVGKFKVTTYNAKDNNSSCVVAISSYLKKGVSIGYLEDAIAPAKRGLLRRFGGRIKEENYIKSGAVSGYEMELQAKNGKLVTSRIFLQKNNSFNLLCIASNDDWSKNDEFMTSFNFI